MKTAQSGGKRAVPRHTDQSADSAARQERAIERVTRREGREEIKDQLAQAAPKTDREKLEDMLMRAGISYTWRRCRSYVDQNGAYQDMRDGVEISIDENTRHEIDFAFDAEGNLKGVWDGGF